MKHQSKADAARSSRIGQDNRSDHSIIERHMKWVDRDKKESAAHLNELIAIKKRSVKLKELIEYRDLGVISEDEFKMKARLIFN